jgi:hypothetical protein
MARISTDNIQVNVEINGERAGKSLKEMRQDVKSVARELDALPAQSEEWYKKLEEYNRAKAALQEIEGQVKGVSDAMKNAGSAADAAGKATANAAGGVNIFKGALQTLQSAILPLLAFSTVVNLVKEGITAFDEQAKSVDNLTRKMDGSAEAVGRLQAQAQKLSGITLFTDNEILKAQDILSTYADTEAQIEKLTPIILDYATDTKQSLEQAAETIGVALTQEAGALEDLGVKFDESASKADRLAIIQDVLKEKTAGAAQTAAEAGTGPLQKLGNIFKELFERVGGLVVSLTDLFKPAIDLTIQTLGPVIDSISFLADKIGGITNKVKEFFGIVSTNAVNINQFVDDMTTKLVDKYRQMTEEERKHWEQTSKLSVEQRQKIIDRSKQMDQDELDARNAALIRQREADKAGATERKALADKYAAEMEAAQADTLRRRAQLIDDDRERELELLRLKYEQELEAVKGSEAQRAEARLLIEEQYQVDRQDINTKYDDQYREFLVDAALRREQITDNILGRELDRLTIQADAELGIIRDKQATITKIDQDAERQRLDNAKRSAEQRRRIEETGREVIKDSLDFFVDLLGQDAEARKKHANAIKAFETGKVLVNLYTEIQNIWKHAADLGPAGTVFAALQSAFAAARAGLAINNISTQKFERGGVVNGPSHAQGGVKLVDGATGELRGEMEGGEPYMILSGNTYRNNRSIIDALLDTSMNRGGAAIFADGGIFTPSAPMVNVPTSVSISGSSMPPDLAMEIRAMRMALQAWPTELEATVSLSNLNTAAKERNRIQSESAV